MHGNGAKNPRCPTAVCMHASGVARRRAAGTRQQLAQPSRGIGQPIFPSNRHLSLSGVNELNGDGVAMQIQRTETEKFLQCRTKIGIRVIMAWQSHGSQQFTNGQPATLQSLTKDSSELARIWVATSANRSLTDSGAEVN